MTRSFAMRVLKRTRDALRHTDCEEGGWREHMRRVRAASESESESESVHRIVDEPRARLGEALGDGAVWCHWEALDDGRNDEWQRVRYHCATASKDYEDRVCARARVHIDRPR